jgi:hypothetical protein
MFGSSMKMWIRPPGAFARTTCRMSTADRRLAPPDTSHPFGTFSVNAPSFGSRQF